jgi:hypothetical protein
MALLRRHCGEDVDIAPSPNDILVLATASPAGVPASDARALVRRLKDADSIDLPPWRLTLPRTRRPSKVLGSGRRHPSLLMPFGDIVRAASYRKPVRAWEIHDIH